MNANDIKKNANDPPAAATPVQNPASQPHGTTQDQVNEMESEGQAIKQGQSPNTSPPGTQATPKPGQKQEEWTKVSPGDQLVKFTYSELPNGEAFLTAQVAGHEVVCSVILPHVEHPFSREGVERHFEHGTDFGLRPRAT